MTERTEFVMLEARHIDDLTQATRAHNTTTAMAEVARARDHREAMAKSETTHSLLGRAVALLEKVAMTLPALIDQQVPAKTNGHGHTKENDDGPDPR